MARRGGPEAGVRSLREAGGWGQGGGSERTGGPGWEMLCAMATVTGWRQAGEWAGERSPGMGVPERAGDGERAGCLASFP